MAQNCLGRGSPAICRVSGFRRRPSPPANSNAHGGVGIVRMIAPPFWDLMLRPGLRTSAEKGNSHAGCAPPPTATFFPGLPVKATRDSARQEGRSTGGGVERDCERVEDVATEETVERVAGQRVHDHRERSHPSAGHLEKRDGY